MAEFSVFFLFKRKTAYDVRISDWSSDVCSSDLLTVGELIPSHRLSMTQNLQRSRAKQHLMARAYKPLVVDVQPGTEYRIGVRLRKDRLDYASIRDNEYWEPVVWEQRAATCR